MPTIPASAIVAVTPSVLAAGGDALNLSGLLLTTSTRVPIGTVPSFPDQPAVASYFGADSQENYLAGIYFGGYANSLAKPGAMLFSQYNIDAVYAYLRGGNISSLSLTQLQAISGPLSVIVDGVNKSGTVNLASATSFSGAAALIADALGLLGVETAQFTASQGASFTGNAVGASLTVTAVTGVLHPGDTLAGTGGVPANTTILSQVSGTIGGAGVYTTSNPTTVSAAPLTTTSTTLDVSGMLSGTIGTNQVISGASVTADTYITGFGTASGSVGTYLTNTLQRFDSTQVTANIPGCIYDSLSGAFTINSGTTGAASTVSYGTGTAATPLKLTQMTGAVLSQGADPATPVEFMDALVAVTQNWASFGLAFDPDGGSGFANKLAFAEWTDGTNQRYMFSCWDTDASPTTQNPATGCLGQAIKSAGYSGTALVWQPVDLPTIPTPDSTAAGLNAIASIAVFQMGAVAAIDFDVPNGRTDLDFRSQSGLFAEVTNRTVEANLIANGYNSYAAYGTANANFIFLNNGQISGPFKWIDSYINQIWMNNNFQLALMVLLTTTGFVPFNAAGQGKMETALADPINQAVAFGAIQTGVSLSEAEKSAVNAMAGNLNIAPTLQTRGWYLYVVPASTAVRTARGPQQLIFFYVDGESVQTINLSSVLVQ